MDTHCTMIQLLVVWQRLDVSQSTNSVIMRTEPVKIMAIGAVLALSAIKWVSDVYSKSTVILLVAFFNTLFGHFCLNSRDNNTFIRSTLMNFVI